MNASPVQIVFIESAVREVPEFLNDTIIQRGEVGATLWLAHHNNIPALCPEPDDAEQRRALCAQFSARDVAYTLIIQNLTAWGRKKVKLFDFNEAIKRSISREEKFSELYGFMPDDAWLFEQHKKLFNDQPLEDKQFLDRISDPRRNDTLVNTIVVARSNMRNEYIAKQISEAWHQGRSVFITYGNGHLPILEPVLHAMVEGRAQY